MVEFLRKIKREITWLIRYINFIIKNNNKLHNTSKKIFLLGSPLYKNLGDVAINLSELKMIKDNFEKIEIIEIPYELSYVHISRFRRQIKDNLILIIGGGFMGTVWIQSENFIRSVIMNYPENKIIIMPQTAYFDSKKEFELSKKIYSSHKNLLVCAREEQTYDLLKNKFKINTILVPDSVLYLDSMYHEKNKSGILFCVRNDIEKVAFDINKLIKYLEEKFSKENIVFLDNSECEKVTFKNREKQFKERIQCFSKKKIIITDRLHGMIFGVISGSITVAFDNKTKKISNVYKWLKSQKNVICASNIEEAINFIEKVKIKDYNFKGMKKEFTPLINEIGKYINE